MKTSDLFKVFDFELGNIIIELLIKPSDRNYFSPTI